MRYYHTGIGRFMSRDMLAQAVDEGKITPAELAAKGIKLPMHLYAYSDNNPVNKLDPTGLVPGSLAGDFSDWGGEGYDHWGDKLSDDLRSPFERELEDYSDRISEEIEGPAGLDFPAPPTLLAPALPTPPGETSCKCGPDITDALIKLFERIAKES